LFKQEDENDMQRGGRRENEKTTEKQKEK